MMKDDNHSKTPEEIPMRKNSEKVKPTKDRLKPDSNNPINPKKDDPE